MVNRYEFLRRVVREEDNEKCNAFRIACLLSGVLIGLISEFLTLRINSGICREVVRHDQLLFILSPLVVVVVAAAAVLLPPPPPQPLLVSSSAALNPVTVFGSDVCTLLTIQCS